MLKFYQIVNSVSVKDLNSLKNPFINKLISELSEEKYKNKYFLPHYIEKVVISFVFSSEFDARICFRFRFGYSMCRIEKTVYFREGRFKYKYNTFSKADDLIKCVLDNIKNDIMSGLDEFYKKRW